MKPKVIAHRGASGLFPENTLVSVRAALNKSVDFIEIDVRLSKDGVPVVIHDDSVARTTGNLQEAMVHELSSHEIQSFEVGSWFSEDFRGERVPLLAELLELEWHGTGLMIEIKESPFTDAIVVEAVFHVLESAKKVPKKMIIGSFSPSILVEVQRRLEYSHVSVNCIGILEELDFIERFIAQGITHLAIWDDKLSASLIKKLKDENIEVWSFTVDELEAIHMLTSMQIDGLISNHPDRF